MRRLKPFFRFFILTAFLFSGQMAISQPLADTTIHAVAQQMPEFPGGPQAKLKFLTTHLRYPVEAVQHEVSGKVYVGFVVEPDGSISHIKVLKGIGYGCDKEAMQVVAQMPKWIPGKNNGKPVRVRYTLLVSFHLRAPEERKVYSHVDVYPHFDVNNYGGIEEFLQFHLRYPVDIVKKRVNDTVNVYFVVEANDSITHVMVNKDTSQMDAYDYEAIRVVKKLHVLAPAHVQHKPVAVRLFAPVIFDYKQADTSSLILRITVNRKTFSYFSPEKIYKAKHVDKMPSFPGGIGALMQYLTENIRYPEEAKKMHLHGMVFLQFIVEGDGSITHIRVLRGVSPSLDAEAVKVIRNMPRWIPGNQRGKPVRVRFILPIKFAMQ